MRKIVLCGIFATFLCGSAVAQNSSSDQSTPPANAAGAPSDQSTPPPNAAVAPSGQSVPPPSPNKAPASNGAPAPGPAAGQRLSNRDLIISCRDEARLKGLRGIALRSAIDDCVSAQNPMLGTRLRCAQKGRAQGVAPGDPLRAFVRTCVGQPH